MVRKSTTGPHSAESSAVACRCSYVVSKATESTSGLQVLEAIIVAPLPPTPCCAEPGVSSRGSGEARAERPNINAVHALHSHNCPFRLSKPTEMLLWLPRDKNPRSHAPKKVWWKAWNQRRERLLQQHIRTLAQLSHMGVTLRCPHAFCHVAHKIVTYKAHKYHYINRGIRSN